MEEKIYASELAGHCNEPTAWQILKEVSEALLNEGLKTVDPYRIEIRDDGHFTLEASSDTSRRESFDAPESTYGVPTNASIVWSLGASLFYLVMGCQVMNDKGGKGQRENSRLPYMRSEWPELSELIQQCLNFAPTKRPTLKDIHDKATQQYERCKEDIQRGPKFKTTGRTNPSETETIEDDLAFWPEKM